MTEEAKLERTDAGLVPDREGWFVVGPREARWLHVPGRSAYSDFEADHPFAQLGISLSVSSPARRCW